MSLSWGSADSSVPTDDRYTQMTSSSLLQTGVTQITKKLEGVWMFSHKHAMCLRADRSFTLNYNVSQHYIYMYRSWKSFLQKLKSLLPTNLSMHLTLTKFIHLLSIFIYILIYLATHLIAFYFCQCCFMVRHLSRSVPEHLRLCSSVKADTLSHPQCDQST